MSPAGPNSSDQATQSSGAQPAAKSRPEEHSELDHRLANSLQLAADFLIFEHTRVSDPRARAALIETADRLSAVGQMHRFLAVRHQATGIDLEPFLAELGGLIADTTGLRCAVDAEAVVIDAQMAQQLAIAVNELAMNAAKHAYAWGDRGPLTITCRRKGDSLALSVADEGAGLHAGFDAAKPAGLGMTILQAIVRQLHGNLEAISNRGARFIITVPLPPPAAPMRRTFSRRD